MKKLLIIGFALLLSVPALATDWIFYGSARFATWYQSGKAAGLYDDDDNGNLNVRDSKTIWELAGDSRIGGKVRHEKVEGRFEYDTGVNVRHLYGVWKPHGDSGWQILVGQTFTPISATLYSNQVYFNDENLLAEGTVYSCLKPMIQFGYKGFKVAFIKVTGESDKGTLYPTDDGSFDPSAGIGDPGDVKVLLPKIEALYHYDSNQFFFDVYGGYQFFSIEDPNGDSDVDVQSYVIGGGGGVTFGPAYSRVQVNYGQNWGDYGAYNHDLQFWGNPGTTGPVLAIQASKSVLTVSTDAAGNPSYHAEDTASFVVQEILGYKVNDRFKFEGGVAYMQHDNDFYINDARLTTYYLQTTVTLTRGFFIVPEFGLFNLHDRLDENRSAGDFWYAGAMWYVNF